MAKKWEKLDNVSKNIAEEPWSLYWNEFKSGTKEFENFLHDPLKTLVTAVDGVDRKFTVNTTVVNHEKGLNLSAVCSLCIVDPEKSACT
jgi:hypothetical protein